MGEHYSTRRPRSAHRLATVSVTSHGLRLVLRTDAGVFARGGLDRGTELLLEAMEIGPCELILDLGCGYGVLGIAAAKLTEGGHVILTDVNERAAGLAKANLRVNAIANAEVRVGDVYEPVQNLAFDHILCNPPLRAGRAVVDRIVTEAPSHLLDGGRLWLVARTRQGAEALRDRMAGAFGNSAVVRRGSGYKVLCSTKEGPSP